MAGDDGSPAVFVEGLEKNYGKVRALRAVDFVVPRGTVLGLLGPNGAGKTTAVRVLTTLTPPTAGTARVAGFDVVRDAEAVRRRIGLAGQSAAIQVELTGSENLEIVGQLHHLRRSAARARAAELIDQFDLGDAADRPAKTYSGGMQRRLDLAASLVGRPSVLFLDEPTTGLDPRSRLAMWEVIRRLVRDGTTMLLTTQYLEEADELATEIVVFDHGKVIAAGTAAELKGNIGGDVLAFVVRDPQRRAAALRAVGPLGHGEPSVDDYGLVQLRVGTGSSNVLVDAVRRLDDVGVEIQDLALRQPSLDDVFLALTGRPAEEDGAADEHPPAARRGARKGRR